MLAQPAAEARTIAVNLGGEEVSLPGGEEERMGETSAIIN